MAIVDQQHARYIGIARARPRLYSHRPARNATRLCRLIRVDPQYNFNADDNLYTLVIVAYETIAVFTMSTVIPTSTVIRYVLAAPT